MDEINTLSDTSTLINDSRVPIEPQPTPPPTKHVLLEKIWRFIFWSIILAGFFSLIYYFVATPHLIIGDPLPVFSNAKYALGEKFSYLIWEPNKGDIIIFDQDGHSRIGVINNWSGPENNIQYEIFSSPNQVFPSMVSRNQIKEKVYYPTRYGGSSLPAATPTPTSSPSPRPIFMNNRIDPQTGWKINTLYGVGLSFEYPPSWEMSATQGNLQSADGRIKLEINDAATGFECHTVENKETKVLSGKQISINYLRGVVGSENCSDLQASKVITATFALNSKDYVVAYSYNATDVEDEKIFNQILSTFKFSDTPISSTFISYRNEEYKFSFKYPNNLILATYNDDANKGSYHVGNYMSVSLGERRERVLQIIKENIKENIIQQPQELPALVINGKEYPVTKYIFGDGGPSTPEGCYSSSTSISYYVDLDNTYLIETGAQESKKTCNDIVVEDNNTFDNVIPTAKKIISTFNILK